jgi:hypothetical protein
MKFEKIAAGMVLYDVQSTRMGNTTMKSLGTWSVRIISVDQESRSAVVSWNGNPPRTYGERALAKLKARRPILIRTEMGRMRRPTREERAAILAEQKAKAAA